MNPYTTLLSKAVRAASLNTSATRETVYQHARKTLLAHLTEAAATPERVAQEVECLDRAIAGVEETMLSLSVDAEPAREPRPGHQAEPATPAAPRGGAAAKPRGRIKGLAPSRLIPPLQVGGFVFKILALLSNPYFLLFSLCLGVGIGLTSKATTAVLAPIADIYVELLKMVLIPFMISAIVVSLSRLFGTEAMRRHLGSIFAIFIAGLAVTALLGILSAAVMSPGGGISGVARQALGQLINQSPYAVDIEVTMNAAPPADPVTGPLLDRIIPDNIFHALTAGENLKILFFAIAFGIGLGSLQTHRSEGLRVAMLSLYDVCTQLIAWVNMLLPVALCGMIAKQVATVGTDQLLAMLKFTLAFSVTSVLLCAVSIAVIAWMSGQNLFKTIQAIREPLLLAMATRSSITCIPSAITALTGRLGYDATQVQLLLPLGITLFRFGPVLYYAFTTIFVAQLYGVSLSPLAYVLTLAASALTGLASAGTSGVLTISLLGVIFQPLGMPLEAALALLVTVDPIIDIFRTAAIVVPNCAAVSIIYRSGNGSKRALSAEPRLKVAP